MAGAVLLAVSVLAMGSIPPTLAALFALSAAVLTVVALLHRRSSPSLPPVTIVLAALALWSLLQCVPLPLALLSRLSPQGAAIWTRALVAAGDASPGWAPLSVAPELTLLEAAKWAGYAALSWMGAWWARYRGLSLLCWVVVALALIVGTVTVLHGLAGAQAIYGVYTPLHSFPRWARGPLLNTNHLSAYLSLGFYASLALLVNERSPRPRSLAVLLIASAAFVAGVVALASRAAVGVLALGGLLMPVVLMEATRGKRTRQRRDIQRKTLLTLAGVFGLGVTLALYGFGDGVVAGLGEKNFSKLHTARDCLPMVRDFWLTGAGRGAFEGAFFRYKSPGDYESWGHPENLALQWSIEWGLPIAALAAVGLLVALLTSPGWRSSRSARMLALGLLMLALHNLLDYSLEVAGVAALAAVLLGALSGKRESRIDSGENVIPRLARPWRRGVPLALAVLGGACAVLTLARGPEQLSQVRSKASHLLRKGREIAPPETDVTPFRDWVRRFPADPYLPAAAGMRLSPAQPQLALRWFGHALERGPNLGVVRLGLAEALGRAGFRQQALLEVRLGLERDPTITAQAIPLTVSLIRNVDEIFLTAPRGPRSLAFLEAMVGQVRGNKDLYVPLSQRILQHDPCSALLQENSIQQKIAILEARQAPCSGEAGVDACRSEIEDALNKVRLCPELGGLESRLRSDLLWAIGDRRAALLALEESCDTAPDLSLCLGRVAERSADLKDIERLRRNLRIVVSRMCQDPAACGQAWAWAARLHERAGDTPSALVAITKATESDPNNQELRYQQALVSLQIGASGRAEMILLQILARTPDNARARAKLEEIRSASPRPSASAVLPPPKFPVKPTR